MPAISPHDITGLVLAGGQGRRMGGRDKGLMTVRGQPLAGWTLAQLAGQTGAQAISANRHLHAYRRLGVPVWVDAGQGGGEDGGGGTDGTDAPSVFMGPLAGMAAGLVHCTTPWLAVVPCDSPCFPADLVVRLAQGLMEVKGADAQADVAFAVSDQPYTLGSPALPPRPQPVFCLLRTALRTDLQRFLAGGGRRVLGWMQQCRHVGVRFDDPAAFAGANTPQELAALALLLERRLTG